MIVLDSKSTILQIPANFYDSVVFYQDLEKTKQNSTNFFSVKGWLRKQQIEQQFPILKNFQLDHQIKYFRQDLINNFSFLPEIIFEENFIINKDYRNAFPVPL